MEFLLISENKIKISLAKADLDKYNIKCDDIDYDNTETRKIFWTLFDEAKRKTGFDAAKNRIFIQIYPGKDGGCELYVSKITGQYKKDAADEISVDLLRGLGKKTEKENRTENAVYCFEKMDELILVCKRLRHIGYCKRSSAFSEGRVRFYLLLETVGNRESFIDEYGKFQKSEGIMLYINEHCRCICDGDAVERISTL